ncbi:hypothetical protein AVEN_67509-1 [Araneus ventricosus]|uniref:OTU domain-containing protein n=1 Tax=Araneus ventricosus TaxID=182803 RepID=A0A4Y2V4P9_ARAVE|nr:hypothetical protein AVEN_67509-1 [Araneus ventricosus]
MAFFLLETPEKHSVVRKTAVMFVYENWNNFKDFLMEESREAYRRNMSMSQTYGTEVEILACAEKFSCSFTIFYKDHPDLKPTVIGNSPPECYILYTGPWDDGHFDVLLPMSMESSELLNYKVAMNYLRRRVSQDLGNEH